MGATTQHNKNSKNGNPATPKEAHRGRREDNRKTTGRNTNRKEQHKGVTVREEPRNRPKTKQRARKARPKTKQRARKARPKQKRGSRRGRTTKGRAKDPHKATASGSRSLSGAKGQVALGTKSKGEETKRRGGRYVIPRVVYSR